MTKQFPLTRAQAINGLLRGAVLTVKAKGEFPLTAMVGRYPGLIRGRVRFYTVLESPADRKVRCFDITRAQALAFIERNYRDAA